MLARLSVKERTAALAVFAAAISLSGLWQPPTPSPTSTRPGLLDVSAFGAVCDGTHDDGPAIQRAIDALPYRGGVVGFPAEVCIVDTPLRITKNNVWLLGTGRQGTVLKTTRPDIHTIVVTDVTEFRLDSMRIAGPGRSSRGIGVLMINVHRSLVTEAFIDRFDVGLRLEPGARSSFSNEIRSTVISWNNSVNIDALRDTNDLALYHVTFGGAPTEVGLRVVESATLQIFGGDCEGVSVTCIELDSINRPMHAAHFISGVTFESNSAPEAEIRIGRTQPIAGVTIISNYFGSWNTAAPIHVFQGSEIVMQGNIIASRYTRQNGPFFAQTANRVSTGNSWDR